MSPTLFSYVVYRAEQPAGRRCKHAAGAAGSLAAGCWGVGQPPPGGALALLPLCARASRCRPPPQPLFFQHHAQDHHVLQMCRGELLGATPHLLNHPLILPPSFWQVENIALLSNAKDIGFIGVNM